MARQAARPARRGQSDPCARQAVGSFEAAALLGVHFTQPAKMVGKGLLSAHTINTDTRSFLVYDGAECEQNFLDYDEEFRARGGKTERRPRSSVHLRPAALTRLRAIQTPIAFDDAIGAPEAAKILGVHVTFLGRLAKAGKIVGRQPWNPRARSDAGKVWIFSRRSCVANVREVRALQASGKKVGRPRKLS